MVPRHHSLTLPFRSLPWLTPQVHLRDERFDCEQRHAEAQAALECLKGEAARLASAAESLAPAGGGVANPAADADFKREEARLQVAIAEGLRATRSAAMATSVAEAAAAAARQGVAALLRVLSERAPLSALQQAVLSRWEELYTRRQAEAEEKARTSQLLALASSGDASGAGAQRQAALGSSHLLGPQPSVRRGAGGGGAAAFAATLSIGGGGGAGAGAGGSGSGSVRALMAVAIPDSALLDSLFAPLLAADAELRGSLGPLPAPGSGAGGPQGGGSGAAATKQRQREQQQRLELQQRVLLQRTLQQRPEEAAKQLGCVDLWLEGVLGALGGAFAGAQQQQQWQRKQLTSRDDGGRGDEEDGSGSWRPPLPPPPSPWQYLGKGSGKGPLPSWMPHRSLFAAGIPLPDPRTPRVAESSRAELGRLGLLPSPLGARGNLHRRSSDAVQEGEEADCVAPLRGGGGGGLEKCVSGLSAADAAAALGEAEDRGGSGSGAGPQEPHLPSALGAGGGGRQRPNVPRLSLPISGGAGGGASWGNASTGAPPPPGSSTRDTPSSALSSATGYTGYTTGGSVTQRTATTDPGLASPQVCFWESSSEGTSRKPDAGAGAAAATGAAFSSQLQKASGGGGAGSSAAAAGGPRKTSQQHKSGGVVPPLQMHTVGVIGALNTERGACSRRSFGRPSPLAISAL